MYKGIIQTKNLLYNLNKMRQENIPFTQNSKLHIHDYKDNGRFLLCSCGKRKLKLIESTKREGIYIGRKINGVKMSVRKNVNRYFFPQEWLNFLNTLKPSKQVFYETLLQSGARISEALAIRPKDYDYERRTLTLYLTKSKAKKGERKEFGGKPRTFQVSSTYLKRVRNYIKFYKLKPDEKLFKMNRQSAWNMMKKRLRKIGIKDWYNFGLHNIRKTTGMWLKSLIPYSREITEGEICLRLGHDFDTFLKCYMSPSIFSERDKNMMIKILGDIYGLK